MSGKTVEVFETTAGQVASVLNRLGVAKEQIVTVVIEPDDWLTSARKESRSLVVAAGLTDKGIDRLIEELRKEVADDEE